MDTSATEKQTDFKTKIFSFLGCVRVKLLSGAFVLKLNCAVCPPLFPRPNCAKACLYNCQQARILRGAMGCGLRNLLVIKSNKERYSRYILK